jgi:hypothetical protein
VAVRNARSEALARAFQPRMGDHIGLDPGFIDENQTLGVGSQLVGDDNRRNETLVTKEFAKQPQCRGLVAMGLNENFENLAFAVNGTPHVHLASGDRDHHFVEMPMSVGLGLFSRKFLAMIGPNLSTHRRIDSVS